MTDVLRDLDLVKMLKRHEGLRLRPYMDTVGKMTIGYGRNLSDSGISETEAEAMLVHDVERAMADLKRVLPWFETLDAVRQDVLINMCFNMGIKRLSKFTLMLAACAAGSFVEAARQMLQSRWADQVGARAIELAAMMRTGTYREVT